MGDADAGDDAKSEAALEECVRLLSSDSREKKFVGMLLVTRLVPDADDDATLTRVYEATGFARFVTSMLRAAPAPPGDGVPATAEEAEARAAQATASHALALASRAPGRGGWPCEPTARSGRRRSGSLKRARTLSLSGTYWSSGISPSVASAASTSTMLGAILFDMSGRAAQGAVAERGAARV